MIKVQKFFGIVFIAIVFYSCTSKTKSVQDNVLVQIGDEILTTEKLNEIIPGNVSAEDSISLAENYIKQWIGDILLYQKAKSNVSNLQQIDELVDHYRRQLILFEYQKGLIEQKLSTQITDEQTLAFYNQHADQFKLKSPIVKGLFLKLPLNAPQINEVKQWVRKADTKSLEKIEKYSLKNALVYELFFDNWVLFNDVMNNIPHSIADPDAFLKKNSNLEVRDSTSWYLLKIIQYLPEGNKEPYEFAQNQIKEILINKRKLEFMKNFRDELYNSAVANKKIIFYNEQKNK